MSIKTYTFQGKCRWAFVTRKSPKYDNYSVNFYPADDATRRAVKATGIRNSIKEDEHGFYYVLRNMKDAPEVVDADGNPWPEDVIIGDGSTIQVQLTVEEFMSSKHGKQTRGALTGVVVLDLVPYEKKEELPK